MKKFSFIFLLFLAACTPAEEQGIVVDEAALTSVYQDYLNDANPWIQINVAGYEPMVVELFPSVAPQTVEHILNLVNDGFYQDIIFHRVIESFMIQGGDPTGTGTGGAGVNIVGEFSINNIDNPLSHGRGVISMARAMDYNSASSQFFIVHQDSDFLDGGYAAFGGLISGFSTLDAIATTPTLTGDRPVREVVITSIEQRSR
jgi:peptidyl-prolyl cis-trans isomerase B (cyclophilin B)